MTDSVPLLFLGASVEILKIGQVEYYRTLKMGRYENIYWSRWFKTPEKDRRKWRLNAFKLADATYTKRVVHEVTAPKVRKL